MFKSTTVRSRLFVRNHFMLEKDKRRRQSNSNRESWSFGISLNICHPSVRRQSCLHASTHSIEWINFGFKFGGVREQSAFFYGKEDLIWNYWIWLIEELRKEKSHGAWGFESLHLAWKHFIVHGCHTSRDLHWIWGNWSRRLELEVRKLRKGSASTRSD
jgi:hypothetical protein